MTKNIPRYIEIDVTLFEKMDDLRSKITLRVAHTGLNPNKSHFTKPALEFLAQTVIGAPIIGRINEETGHFEGHNVKREIKNGKLQKTFNTRPYGYVPEWAKPRFETFETSKGPLEYLVVDGVLWNRYPEAIEAFELNGGKIKQSMELHMDHTGYKVDEVYYWEEAKVTGLCLLGPDRTSGMVEPTVTLFEMDDELQKEFEALKKEFEEEGTEMPTLDEIKAAAKAQMDSQFNPENADAQKPEVTEEPVTTEPVVEEQTVEEEPETEPVVEEQTIIEGDKPEVTEEPIVEPDKEPIDNSVVKEDTGNESVKDDIKLTEAITEFTTSELFTALPDAARKAISNMIERCENEVRYLQACINDANAEKDRYSSRMDNEIAMLNSDIAKFQSEIGELQTALTTFEAKELEAKKDAKLEELKPVLTTEEFESLEENRAELTVEEMEAAAAQFVLENAKKTATTFEVEKTPVVKARTTAPKKKAKQSRYGSLEKYFK